MGNLGVRDVTSLGRDNIVVPGQIPSFGTPQQRRN
jgi:hypothetical protein